MTEQTQCCNDETPPAPRLREQAPGASWWVGLGATLSVMRWRRMDKVEGASIVIYFVGVLVFIIFATYALIAGERSTWTVYAMLLWQIAFTAFGPLYRRWRSKNRADESVDKESGGASV